MTDASTGAPDREPPWPHQQQFLDWWRPTMRGVIAHIGMSGGKSRIAIEAMERARTRNVLLICPLRVRGIWTTEPPLWSSRTWRTWGGEVLGKRGKPKKRPTVREQVAALRELMDTNPGTVDSPLMVSLHYDVAHHGALLAALLECPFDMLILDEVHRVKSPTGKASKAVSRLGSMVRARGGYVLGLTGTMFPHTELDAWAQLRVVNPDLLPTSFTVFRNQYGQRRVRYVTNEGVPVYSTTPHGTPIWDGVAPERRAELLDRISAAVFTVPQDDLDRMIGLKGAIDRTWEVDPDPVTRRAHDELERDGSTLVRDGQIDAANAMVATLRMAQVTSGAAALREAIPEEQLRAMLADGDLDAVLKHNASRTSPLHEGGILQAPKAQLLGEVLEDLPRDRPVVVFGWFQHDMDVVEAWAKKLGLRYGELSGRRRDALDDRSQLTPGVQLAAVQIQSGGVGVNFTAASHAIFYSVGHNLGNYLQARKRLHRHGQPGVVTLHHLVVRGTIDDVIARALRDRADIVQAATTYLSTQTGVKA